MSTTPTTAEEAITTDDAPAYSSDHRKATLEGGKAAHNIPSFTVTCRHSAVQTLPPANAHQFGIIYGRKPTEREIVKKIGTAAIDRYGTGLTASPYDTATYAPFVITQDQAGAGACDSSSFQTCSVAQCNISLARAKAKASVLVSRQRNAALDVGYNVWVDANDDMIAHMEQHVIRLQFDEFGNAINTEVHGLSLPNICGEEIYPDGEHDRALTTDYTAMPDPPPPPLVEEERDRLHLRPLQALQPASPETALNPWALEDYEYIKEASPGEGDETWGWEEMGTELEIGGPRFADQFAVYDPTQDLPPVPRSASPAAPAKLKNKARKQNPSTNIYRRDEEHSQERKNTPDQSQVIEKATPEPSQARGQAFSTQSRDGSDHAASREYSGRDAQFYHRFTGERSRSPEDRHNKTHYRSRSPAESVNTSAWSIREDKNQHQQKEAKIATRRANGVKDEWRQERKTRRQKEKIERQHQEYEAEVERAREAKNRFKQEMEESRRMRDAKRVAQDATTAPHYSREASLRRKGKTESNQHTDNQESSAEVDQYALAREAENHRRELAQARFSSETPLTHSRDRSTHTTRRGDRNTRGVEKKVEDDKVTKTKGKRDPRQELERYDPRKKFGAGR